MARRYIGSAVIFIIFDEAYRGPGAWGYRGSIRAGAHRWRFDRVGAPAVGLDGLSADEPEAYDRMAVSAVSFGGFSTKDSPGDGFPDKETANAIEQAALEGLVDDKYMVRRSPNGPAHPVRV